MFCRIVTSKFSRFGTYGLSIVTGPTSGSNSPHIVFVFEAKECRVPQISNRRADSCRRSMAALNVANGNRIATDRVQPQHKHSRPLGGRTEVSCIQDDRS